MAETDSGDLITWNRGLMQREPPIWISGATTLKEEATGLVFGAILMVNFFRKDGKKEEKTRSFSW